jgi:hypothetical protein
MSNLYIASVEAVGIKIKVLIKENLVWLFCYSFETNIETLEKINHKHQKKTFHEIFKIKSKFSGKENCSIKVLMRLHGIVDNVINWLMR